MQITVLGMHRSGTTLLTRMIHLLGASLGDELAFNPPTEDNPRGFYERKDVWTLSERTFAAAGRSWFDIVDFDPLAIDAGTHAAFGAEARRIIALLDEHRPWVLKDPRLCVLFPLWRPLLQEPVCVLIHRDPLQVARSLLRRDGFPLLVGVALWEHYTLAALDATRSLPRLLVRHEDLLRDPLGTSRRLLAELRRAGVEGLTEADEERASRLVELELFRSHSEPGDDDNFLSPSQRRLKATLEDGTALTSAETPAPWPGGTDLLRWFGRDHRSSAVRDSELDELHRTAADLHRRIAEQHSELDRLHPKIAQQHAEIDRLHQKAAEQHAEIDRLHQRIAEDQAIIVEHERRLSEAGSQGDEFGE